MAKYFNFGENVPKRKQDEALDSEAEKILDAYFQDESDSGRFTSEEIAANVRETLKVTTAQVFDYMSSHGYRLERVDDRLVWVID
jgi:hypothetical protein